MELPYSLPSDPPTTLETECTNSNHPNHPYDVPPDKPYQARPAIGRRSRGQRQRPVDSHRIHRYVLNGAQATVAFRRWQCTNEANRAFLGHLAHRRIFTEIQQEHRLHQDIRFHPSKCPHALFDNTTTDSYKQKGLFLTKKHMLCKLDSGLPCEWASFDAGFRTSKAWFFATEGDAKDTDKHKKGEVVEVKDGEAQYLGGEYVWFIVVNENKELKN
ncbi:Uu.00g140150.m01.CDS01 [Anthostomella pinea]|uniref:Uu.00g140150.m01.CDS01 n=1 Tax=Anthostomella pinea TaxID=933095 RepID=A0AAI8YLD7_9PEZI|nr:Uu.00g140150.m01.CDS01 [Anthostomella pinea]